MFDTLVYTPTVLAYVFISLLVMILSLLVVYISHNVYVMVHHNLSFYTFNKKDPANCARAAVNISITIGDCLLTIHTIAVGHRLGRQVLRYSENFARLVNF